MKTAVLYDVVIQSYYNFQTNLQFDLKGDFEQKKLENLKIGVFVLFEQYLDESLEEVHQLTLDFFADSLELHYIDSAYRIETVTNDEHHI
jgi:hypothetical protein